MPDAEWKVIALLYKLEDLQPSLTEYFESTDYKHEVFRRIIPAAIRMSIISSNIFSDRDRKIKKSEGRLIKQAYKKCLVFFDDITNDVIGLSRAKDSCIYASTDGVEEYLKRFLSSDTKNNSNDGSVNEGGGSGQYNNSNQDENGTENNDSNTSGDDGQSNGAGNGDSGNNSGINALPSGTSNNGVTFSKELELAIAQTRSKKFKQLYNSICTVALRQHPSLVMLGAWAFIEAIATATGKGDGIGIDSHFSKKKLTQWWPNHFTKNQLDDFRHSLEFIRKDANGIKHSSKYRADTALNLRAHFECLDDLLIKVLEKIVADKVKIS